jgi:hypothetical protein
VGNGAALAKGLKARQIELRLIGSRTKATRLYMISISAPPTTDYSGWRIQVPTARSLLSISLPVFGLDTLNRTRRLSPSLFSTASFYSQRSDSDKTERLFNKFIDRAIAASAALLKRNPKDAEALYYQAGALGVWAAYTGTVGRSFKRAIDDANKSAQIQAKVLKLNPEYYDAFLRIGVYEYINRRFAVLLATACAIGRARRRVSGRWNTTPRNRHKQR